jgi:poly-beta-1,6-N-acetyl-D-glucosamine synthase
MLIFAFAYVLCLVLSSMAFSFVSQGWFRALRRQRESATPEALTVIIAAHNEASNIPALFEALNAQSYPLDLVRILLVDDRSEDGSADTATAHAGALQVKVLRIDSAPEGESPKKHALHKGILESDTDILLFTDADCRPEAEWIASMHRVFAAGAEAVVAPAPLDESPSFVGRYSAYESCRTAAFMIAATASGVPYMASGRSWGYRKSLYLRSDGLPSLAHWLGGDDDLLLQQFQSMGARIDCCTEKGAIVRSTAPAAMNELIRQKIRHYSVSRAYRGPAILPLGIVTAAQTLTLPLGILLGVLYLLADNLPAAVLVLLALPWMLWYNAGFIRSVTQYLSVDMSRGSAAFLESFHIIFSAIVGFLSFFRPARW